METFKSSGLFTKQAHVKIPHGLYEEEHGRKGFFGRVSQLYHTHPQTSWIELEGPLRPHCLPDIFWTIEKNKLQNKLQQEEYLNPRGQEEMLLSNEQASLICAHISTPPTCFWRNADADELYFVHGGEGVLETIYGHLEMKRGDYIVVPKGTTCQFFPMPNSPLELFVIESRGGEWEQPERGLLGPNALYDQTKLVTPEAAIGTYKSLSERYIICIKRGGLISKVTYPHNPLEAQGWKGSLYPWKLSIYDICPIMSHRYHIPPSGHTTLMAPGVIICSFVERPLESSEEGVLKVPFYHSNIDFDEVIFYHQGDFFSRDNIGPKALTWHPGGIHHGPHPKAYEASQKQNKTWTDEFAVMVDCRLPLVPSEAFQEKEDPNYWLSWKSSR